MVEDNNIMSLRMGSCNTNIRMCATLMIIDSSSGFGDSEADVGPRLSDQTDSTRSHEMRNKYG